MAMPLHKKIKFSIKDFFSNCENTLKHIALKVAAIKTNIKINLK